jgi:tRNA pseudouridine55 synthase
MTSHDVVNQARRILRQRSVGHLGTLDPMATGVLPLVIGNMTRLAQFYTSSEKTYEGTIRFGFATDTYDSDGQPVGPQQDIKVSLQQLRDLAANFRGTIEQTPPPFSAKKIHGVPAYKLARKHQDVPLKRVRVEIKEFDILGFLERTSSVAGIEINAEEGTHVRFRARVASGTYIRSVAHEMGQQLGCGAHLASLRRTRLAEFALSNAHTLDELRRLPELRTEIAEELEELFVHPRRLLPHMPAVTATPENVARIRAGRPVNLPELSRAREVKVFRDQRELVAIATRVAGTLFHAGIVLAVAEERAAGVAPRS